MSYYERCPHGHQTTTVELPDGWLQDHATSCPVCQGAKIGSAYKPAEPQK